MLVSSTALQYFRRSDPVKGLIDGLSGATVLQKKNVTTDFTVAGLDKVEGATHSMSLSYIIVVHAESQHCSG